MIWICTQLGLFQVTEEGYTQVVQDSLSFVGAMSFRHKIFFVTSDGGIYEKSSGKNLFLTARLPWKLLLLIPMSPVVYRTIGCFLLLRVERCLVCLRKD